MNKPKSTRAAVGDLLYVQIETALQQPCCPLCWHMAEVSQKFFKFLLREGINADNIYQSLMKSQGLCALHAQALARTESPQGGKIGNATLYSRLLERVINSLNVCGSPPPAKTGIFGPSDRQSRYHQQLLESLTPKESCVACLHFQQYEFSVTAGLGRILADTEEENLRILFRQSYLLCLPHFRILLKVSVNNKEAAEFILRCQQQKTQTLFNALQQYIKNCQGPHSEAKQTLLAQDNSWQKALEFFGGKI